MRGTRKNLFFDAEKYYGFNHIISEIDRKENEVSYCSWKSIAEYDYVLVSLSSYYDVYNLMANLMTAQKGNAKIIVGGAGVTNIRLYKDLIDFAVFRRGEGLINDILHGDIVNHRNIWSKEDDPALEKKYQIGRSKFLIGHEKSVGCRKKCYFCQYS